MIKTPYFSPANTSDLKWTGAVSAALATTFTVLLAMPEHPAHPVRGLLENRGQLAISVVIFIVQVVVAVAGCRAVRRTVAATGDSAKAQIQAHTFRAANYATLGTGFLVAPFSNDVPAVLASDAAGVMLLIFAAAIGFTALTPKAIRSRLESEADQRIATSR